MADVDFGDKELFEQIEDSVPQVPKHIIFEDDEETEEVQQLRNRLEECEECMQRLTEENKVLRRKLSILTRPSGVTIADVNIDGPLLQILYTNNSISKQCRQEIEDGICNVILKQQKPVHDKKSSFYIKPQDPLSSSLSSVKATSEAFKVVGSVLYFNTFSVDKLGQPLANENPQMTDGWELPIYSQHFSQIIGTDGQEMELKEKRAKSICFNCSDSSHQLKDCPKPKDMAVIMERRKEFLQNNQAAQNNQRYHADEVEERFARYKPGVLSEELLSALGVDSNSLPPVVYRMRLLGYPPGWLKEAEMENSGLMLYDDSNDGTSTDNRQNTSYDVSKLVDFPGFNVPASDKMKDEFPLYGSIPMQSTHMKNNYAAYLSSNFPLPGANCNKRHHESDSFQPQKKRNKLSPDYNSSRSSDMDIESDPGTTYNNGQGFQFQPPLPPGSPSFSSPPPLPKGTPPATPTPPPLPKGTPPPTPPQHGQSWVEVDEAMEGTDDDLTLEELEEQQRRIWAALENADTASNSECETPAIGTPIPSSPSASTTAQGDTDIEEAEGAMDSNTLASACQSSETEREKEKETQEIFHKSLGQSKVNEDSLQSPEPITVKEDSPQSPRPIRVEEQSPAPPKPEEDSPQSPESIMVEQDNSQSPGPIKEEGNNIKSPRADLSNRDAEKESDREAERITSVPHRSKFAAGIVPFEDTPEYTEVAEATGTYLRIRDLLKCSPRGLAKKKLNI
ncbi:zinc finger CCHC domain-containing protein 8 isoform X2 [Cynoglossus semilaevis]|uniref:zinc finger CCHC domain-containing protein 8 isoform X2 n=1 Tax=Cynoglossus semilaevis TaxID=244447 RepID=UPI000497A225|nr:zinc finger CCHC domain-containing protein 8 isoform X2 [Cynoglossus semilaevis]